MTMQIKEGDAPIAHVEMGETWGTGTFISWDNLNAILRKAGKLKPNEYVKGVNVNEAGFGIYIGNDPENEKPL